MVASPLQIQQALGKAIDSTKGQEPEKKTVKNIMFVLRLEI